MKTRNNIIVRILALILIGLYFLPFVTIYDEAAKRRYDMFEDAKEYSKEYAEKYGQDFSESEWENPYVYEASVSLFEYTFFDGKVQAEAILVPLLILAILIIGTKLYKTSIILSVIFTAWMVFLSTLIPDRLYELASGVSNGNELIISLVTAEIDISLTVFAVLQIVIGALLIVLCAISKKKKAVESVPTYTSIPKTAVPSRVEVDDRKCPVCENIIMPGVSFCTICGTPVAKKAEVAPTPAPGMMTCPSCNAIIDESSAFCTSCGTSLAKKAEVAPTPAPVPGMMACPSCNAIIDGSSAFCTSCGTSLAKKAEVAPTPAPGMMACPNCNAIIDGSSAFCTSCGTSLAKKAEVVSPVEVIPESNPATAATTSPTGIKSTMRTKPSESPEEAMKKAAGQSFFNKPSDL